MSPETLNRDQSHREAEVAARFSAPSLRVGIIGLGYVGLPLALLFARKHFRVTGFDIDGAKVDKLNKRETYIRHIPAESIGAAMEQGVLSATTDFARLRDVEAIIICVPTPLDDHREPDLSYIRDTAESIRPHLQPGQLVVLESTTYPGTTEDVLLPILECSGLKCPVARYTAHDGHPVPTAESAPGDFFAAFSPEREDPGNKKFHTEQIPKVIGGVNAESAVAIQALYGRAFERTVLVSSSRAAEMTKLLENIYRCVNIALVNELKLLCEQMDIDIWEVIEAAKTKPFGFTPFYPGPGLGGHCIPIDPFYLTWKAREYDFPTRFIELAGEINSAMPAHVVTKLAEALDHRKQPLRDARILVLGIAYKKDVDDLRESPSLRIIKLLQGRGAKVDYHDPYFPQLHKMRHYDFASMKSIELSAGNLNRYAAVIIATDHSSYDYSFIVRHAPLVIDTRNATHSINQPEKIVRC